jgi:outer membrane immunogenic protein
LIFGLYTGNNVNFAPAPFSIGGGSGAIGGVQAGYNFQLNRMWVAGVEADIDAANVRSSVIIPQTDLSFGRNVNTIASRRLDWFGTVRGRLGVTPFDRLLIYGTGRLAYGQEKVSASLNSLETVGPFATGFFPADGSGIDCFALSPCAIGSASKFSVGWAAGGGFEYAVWNNLSIKAEYLYMELGRSTAQLGPGVIPPFPNNPSILTDFGNGKYQTVRVGMNWRFNSAAPVSAKY